MAEATRTLPIPAANREFTVKVGGREVGREQHLLGVHVTKEVNRISSARLLYLDGSAAAGDFALSNAATFVPGAEIEILAEARGRASAAFVSREVLSDAKVAYARREESLGTEAMRELERRVVLSVIDRRWRDHLYEMDYLKDGIGLRAMAQRDPLIEYQREGYTMFQAMMGQIKEESVGYLYNLEVEVRRAGDDQTEVEAKGLVDEQPVQKLEYSAPNDAGDVELQAVEGAENGVCVFRVRRGVELVHVVERERAE